MKIIATCEHCNFSAMMDNSKLKDKRYKKSRSYPINYWECLKCGKENFEGIKTTKQL